MKALLPRYARPVPRYTSYPTAPHFTDTVDAETYGRWLSEVPAGETLSLYVHIPFCDTLCWFCGCQTTVVNRYSPIAAYLESLHAEIDRVISALGTGRPVSHIHFGGGSPTILKASDFAVLMRRLGAAFAIAPDAEIAVEIDPRGMTAAYVDALAKAGVTRVSLGVQDLDPTVQEAINRVQPIEETERVAAWCRKAGIADLNIDLMYGLPHQTADGVRDTARRVADVGAGRVALFGYAHVPWMRRHQQLIDDETLPGGAARWDQAEAAADVFAGLGYVAVGLDHFARPDDAMAVALDEYRLRRNFQGYTTDDAGVLLGFGASAVGALPEGFVQNKSDTADYVAAIQSGRLPIARGVVLSDEDRVRGAVIERLMCELAVDLRDECWARGAETTLFDGARPALAALEKDGLIEMTDDRIAIRPEARPFARVVAAVFDAYLPTSSARHSGAV